MASTAVQKPVRERRPDLFQFSDVDRHTCERVVPMEVLSLGFSRTGTSSMELALETLGYPTYHMTSMRTSTTDLPGAAFLEELIAAYPDVKCVLVERELEAWYKSWYDVQIANYDSWFFRIVAAPDPCFIGKLWTVSADCVLKGYVRGRNKRELGQESRDVYKAHNKAVREKVPRNQLLVHELGSGWQPLCAFLEKPVPDVPFPRVNETGMVNEYVQVLIKLRLMDTMKRWAFYTVHIVAAAAAVWWVRS